MAANHPRHGLWGAEREMPTQVNHQVGHQHPELELQILRGGTSQLLHGGERHVIAPDQPVLFWAGIPHSHLLDPDSPPPRLTWFTIPLGEWHQWGLSDGLLQHLLRGGVISIAQPISPDQANDWISGLTQGGRLETIARHELAAVLLRSDQHHDDEAATRPTEAAAPRAMANLAERGVWYLHQHFREPAQVGDVATALGCHPHALMNAFKHHLGCSVLHYQTQLRLAEAARLLVTSSQAINQIWLAVGFGSASRFYACFRDHFGLPPAHYRRQNGRR